MKRLILLLLVLPVMAMAADIGGKPINNPALGDAVKWVYSGRELWDKFEQNLADVKQPKPYVKIWFEQCNTAPNAYFKNTGEIVVCYELVDKLMKTAARKPDMSNLVYGALQFIILHEYGHALIRQNPAVLGKEEDAADQIAAIFARHMRIAPRVMYGVLNAWIPYKVPFQIVNNAMAADVHALDSQRRANVICWAAGDHIPTLNEAIQARLITSQRARGCEQEMRQADHVVRAMVGR